ncbi:hypothetical protein QNI19_29155 [Cytophagaceae bacterium DM2B3-1]|uniref:Uncharacterized protein n=1 Tax=Xanthocytophaga flava TaxID=3048013 RepID=A0ABT7CTE6_9BACT|nr:hypothetical protein [Xanthocytophaga flavus]MDJ1497041.1 hypothetical protein [Xanthocytophaga flavus]
MRIRRNSLWVGLFLCISVAANAQNVAGSGKDSYHVRFDFGSGKVEKGFLPVTPVTLYSKVLGYGFLPEASVHVTLGDSEGESLQYTWSLRNSKVYCVGIKAVKLPVAQYLKEDIPAFDPAKPDAIEIQSLPVSPLVQVIKPDGN